MTSWVCVRLLLAWAVRGPPLTKPWAAHHYGGPGLGRTDGPPIIMVGRAPAKPVGRPSSSWAGPWTSPLDRHLGLAVVTSTVTAVTSSDTKPLTEAFFPVLLLEDPKAKARGGRNPAGFRVSLRGTCMITRELISHEVMISTEVVTR